MLLQLHWRALNLLHFARWNLRGGCQCKQTFRRGYLLGSELPHPVFISFRPVSASTVNAPTAANLRPSHWAPAWRQPWRWRLWVVGIFGCGGGWGGILGPGACRHNFAQKVSNLVVHPVSYRIRRLDKMSFLPCLVVLSCVAFFGLHLLCCVLPLICIA